MTVAVARRRGWVAALLLVFCGLVLGGCGAIEGMLDTEEALVAAGYRDPEVSFESINGLDTVYVSWDASAETSEGLRDESLGVAGVVWRVAPLRMDVVETDPRVSFVADSAEVGTVYPRAQLEQEFGPRSAELDKPLTELMNLREIGIGVVVAVLLFLGLIVLVVVLVLRSSRKKRAARPAYSGYGGYPQQGQWQQGQWQQGGWQAYPQTPQPPPPPQYPSPYPPAAPPPPSGDDPWRPPSG